MANDDLIRGGTASVAAGLVTVTGQGVSWGNVREGDFFGAHVGLAVPITAIIGNVITLAYGWTGPTQVAAAYAIQPKGDVTRFQDRVRQLVESLTNGKIAALAGLAGGADALPFFTGPGTMGQTLLTPYVRTNVLGKPTRADLFYGLNTSADMQPSTRQSTDLNNEFTTGVVSANGYGSPAQTLNCPTTTLGTVFTTGWVGLGWCTQIFIEMIISPNRRQWSRTRNGDTGVWDAWRLEIQEPYFSVEQAGGANMTGNKIRLGWSLSNKLLGQVDTLPLGSMWYDQAAPYERIGGAGYQKLPSGMIIQWGYSTASSVTFPLSFPNASLSVVPQMLTANTTLLLWSIVVNTNNNGGFSVSRRVSGGGGGAVADTGEGYCWVAIGY